MIEYSTLEVLSSPFKLVSAVDYIFGWSLSVTDQLQQNAAHIHPLLALKYYQVSILYKSIADRYRPVRLTDRLITARYRFIKNASWADASK